MVTYVRSSWCFSWMFYMRKVWKLTIGSTIHWTVWCFSLFVTLKVFLTWSSCTCHHHETFCPNKMGSATWILWLHSAWLRKSSLSLHILISSPYICMCLCVCLCICRIWESNFSTLPNHSNFLSYQFLFHDVASCV